jgi:hypothetical protein
MRRASTRLALLGLVALALGLPASALAAPTVKVTVKILPVMKDLTKPKAGFWPHTGNHLGAPAALETKVVIKGTEYGGTPAPIRRFAVWLPKGTVINTKGFKTCPISKLQNKEPEKCPKDSLASPAGHAPESAPESCPSRPLAGGAGEACGIVSIGGQRVHESVKLQAYFAPGGGLNFFIEGATPTVIEEPFAGSFSSASGKFGRKFVASPPLIETLPGAPAAVAESASITIGAAKMVKGKLVSLGRIPSKCPKGGFPGKSEMWFGAGAESTWEKVTSTIKVPCPKK